VLLVDSAGRPLARLSDMGTDEVRYPVFSPDGATLAVLTASELYIWDLAELRRRLREIGLDWSDAPIPERAAMPPPAVRLVGLTRITPATQVSKAELANAALALTANPFDPDANLLLGQFTANVLRDHAAAADRFRLATLALPDSPVAHHDRIEAEWKVARWKEVVEACDEYVRSGGTPDDDWGPQLRYYRGTALQQLGKHADALKEFVKLAEGKTPVRCAAREAAAVSKVALKRPKEGIDIDLKEALAESDGNAARRAEYLLLFPPGGKLDVRLTAHALEVATRGMQQGRGGSMAYPVYLLALHRAGRSAEADKVVPADVLPATGPAGVVAALYVRAMSQFALKKTEAATTLATAARRAGELKTATPHERFLLDQFRNQAEEAFETGSEKAK
jgi:tetratricopeptide (TPR) repeat protein